MKKLFISLLPVLLFVCCRKKNCPEPPVPVHPQMYYTDLNNLAIKFGQLKAVNLDGDNTNDLLFSTQLVGDPILERDRQQYYVSSNFHVSLLVNPHEQMPVLSSGDSIKLHDHPGYNWYNANSIVLAEKIIELTGPAHWEGNWKNADHKYIATQIAKNGVRYNGWVEVSFDTGSEAMILHRAAIALEANKAVIAGY